MILANFASSRLHFFTCSEGAVIAPAETGWWLYQVKDQTLQAIRAGRLKTPTLIVWGMNDPGAPYKMGVELMQLISKSVDRAELHVLNRCGHFAFGEYPVEVANLMANFITAPRST